MDGPQQIAAPPVLPGAEGSVSSAGASIQPWPPPATGEPFLPAHAALVLPGPNESIRKAVTDVLRTVYDPEIPVNIYDLGLIYTVEVDEAGSVHIRMTLTAPNCPAAISLPGEVESRVRSVAGVTGCKVEVVWEPTWNKEMMSEAAKLELGFM